MKEVVPLPSPKDEDLIKYINSQLKVFKVHALEMRTKPNKNEVHICGIETKIQERKQQLEMWIVS